MNSDPTVSNDMPAQESPMDSGRPHAAKIKGCLDDIIDHIRGDLKKVNEPKAQALFETAAEVLIGLRTAVEHYEQQSEAAMTEIAPNRANQRSPRQETCEDHIP